MPPVTDQKGIIHVVLLMSIMVLAIGLAVVQASRSSLPGDFLYPVKEEVASLGLFLANSDQSKASAYAHLASDTLSDAQKLSDQKKTNQMLQSLDTFEGYQKTGLYYYNNSKKSGNKNTDSLTLIVKNQQKEKQLLAKQVETQTSADKTKLAERVERADTMYTTNNQQLNLESVSSSPKVTSSSAPVPVQAQLSQSTSTTVAPVLGTKYVPEKMHEGALP